MSPCCEVLKPWRSFSTVLCFGLICTLTVRNVSTPSEQRLHRLAPEESSFTPTLGLRIRAFHFAIMRYRDDLVICVIDGEQC